MHRSISHPCSLQRMFPRVSAEDIFPCRSARLPFHSGLTSLYLPFSSWKNIFPSPVSTVRSDLTSVFLITSVAIFTSCSHLYPLLPSLPLCITLLGPWQRLLEKIGKKNQLCRVACLCHVFPGSQGAVCRASGGLQTNKSLPGNSLVFLFLQLLFLTTFFCHSLIWSPLCWPEEKKKLFPDL